MSAGIVISEFMNAPEVEALKRRFDVDYRPKLVDDPGELEAALQWADAWVVRNRSQVRGRLLDAAANLKVVGRLGVGLDNIDLAACAARAIAVIPASGANAESVAEYVITAALMLLPGAYASTRAVEAGTRPRQTLSQGREAAGKVLGIIGLGNIGRPSPGRAPAMGVRVIAHHPPLPGSAPRGTEGGSPPPPPP